MDVHVNELPDEVLHHIFSLVPNTELPQIQKVCPRWLTVLDQGQGFLIHPASGTGTGTSQQQQGQEGQQGQETGADLSFAVSADTKHEIEIDISQVGRKGRSFITRLFKPAGPESQTSVHSLSGSGDWIRKKQNHGQGQASLNPDPEKTELYIRKLGFLQLPLSACLPFLKKWDQLTSLQLHFSTFILDSHHTHFSSKTLILPGLSSLTLDCHELHSFFNSPANSLGRRREMLARVRGAYDILTSFLQGVRLPRLETLVFQIPFFREREKAVVTNLVDFMARHASTLKQICLHQPLQFFSNPPPDEDNIDELSLSDLARCGSQLKPLFSLSDLSISIYGPQESAPLWINFLILQDSLSTLTFTGDTIPFPSNLISYNKDTLTTVKLEVRDKVDCTAFQACHSLRKVTLLGLGHEEDDFEDNFDLDHTSSTSIGQDDHDQDNDLNPWRWVDDAEELPYIHTDVLYLTRLPPSVEHLRINGLRTNRESTDALITGEKWAKLRDFELVDCGIEFNLGVSLSSVYFILERKRFQKFRIDYSLNRASLDPCLRSQDPLRLLAFTISNNSISNFRLRGRLTFAGRYEIVRGVEEPLEPLSEDLFTFPESLGATGRYFREKEEEEIEVPLLLDQDQEDGEDCSPTISQTSSSSSSTADSSSSSSSSDIMEETEMEMEIEHRHEPEPEGTETASPSVSASVSALTESSYEDISDED